MVSTYRLHHVIRFIPVFVMVLNVLLFVYSYKNSGISLDTIRVEALKTKLRRTLADHIDYQDTDITHIEAEQPNLPLAFYFNYLSDSQLARDGRNECAVLPNIFAIQHNNLYWQQFIFNLVEDMVDKHGHSHQNVELGFRVKSETAFLYSAFLDTRKLSRVGGGWHNGPSVRVLAMVAIHGSDGQDQPKTDVFCQIWVKRQLNPVLVKVLYFDRLWLPSWGWNQPERLQPYILSCPLAGHDLGQLGVDGADRAGHGPDAVSLIQDTPCGEPTNILSLNYETSLGVYKHDFGVCVKPLSFPEQDLSTQLAEWIETHLMLGVWRLTFYVFSVHPNMEKVLSHYKHLYKDRIVLIPTSLPGQQPNTPKLRHLYLKNKINTKRQNEILIYNDCFMRNMHLVKYVALVDIDEIIVPTESEPKSWAEMMSSVRMGMTEVEKTSVYDAFCFSNTYFFTEPGNSKSPFFTTKHRSFKISPEGHFSKCFHHTELVDVVHNHAPIFCMSEEDSRNCSVFFVDPAIAKLNHYKETCVGILQAECHEYKDITVKDLSLLKYQDSVRQNVENTFSDIFS